MLGLTLKYLKVTSVTNDGAFYTEIYFKNGLNIIRAENSSGKSTCINAIAYALGLDNILGPSRRKPFPRSLYQKLETSKADETEHLVISSYVELEVENNKGIKAHLKRDVKGNDNKVVVTSSNEIRDYFLGSAGSVGSAKSSNGFHFWLESFIDWKLPSLVTHDGKPTRLYLECVFPLFFIEQKRGWSEIQANTPTYYGIKSVKKSAIEFCLGLEDYSKQNKQAELKRTLDDLSQCWEKIKSSAAALAEFSTLRVDFSSTLEKEDFFQLVNYSVPNNNTSIDLYLYTKGLSSKLKELNSDIHQWPLYKEVSELNSKQRGLIEKSNYLQQRKERLTQSISQVELKLKKIYLDLDKYRQLKRLYDVGGTIGIDIQTQECPVCEQEMFDSLAQSDTSPLTLISNIDYLKNQYDFYLGIKAKQNQELELLSNEEKIYTARMEEIETKLTQLKSEEEQFTILFGGQVRKKIELENEINIYKKLLTQQSILNSRAKDIHREWQKANTEYVSIKKTNGKNISTETINQLKNALSNNLTKFGYKSANMNYLNISSHTLRPELDGYDIVADSSASDYIRIIWSYTLALLELGSVNNNVKHGGFVVFDEPRQHETNKASFEALLEKASDIKTGGQIIIATSISVDELNSYRLDDKANITIFKDGEYILQQHT
jgi:hypothetical protein